MTKTSPWLIIGITLLVIAIIGGIYTIMLAQTPKSEKEQVCINSGGTVTTQLCCKSVNDFPDTCLIGACGCSPENSKEVKVCDCGEGKCWDGNKGECTTRSLP